MPTYRKFPYLVEFPDSSEDGRSCQSLQHALWSARWTLHRVWKEDWEGGRKGDPTTDAERAVITNRNTGYRWILRRTRTEVEFQTPEMVEELVANQGIEVHLTVEEAEALARAANPSDIRDRRTKALMDQALDQIAVVCRQVRERVRAGDNVVDEQAVPRLPQASPPASGDQGAFPAFPRPPTHRADSRGPCR